MLFFYISIELFSLTGYFFLFSSNSELQADLIQVLREALVHPSTGVRISTAPLLEVGKVITITELRV